ncbi:MAG: branched-chain amino acid ABC transporter permease [Ardenticatenaceae bacterium]|nr:branched-chain amino acid ABC transporter permease [Ardenticatenaceae bacterium]MCB9442916.1 branched-chain amino acid ABC transporter permease [Ardenticatenaceae bacterium]
MQEGLKIAPSTNKPVNRVTAVLSSFGMTPLGLVVLLLLVALPYIPPFNQEHIIRWLVSAALIAAQAIAFDFTTGYINVVNFGFAAFVGVGAYTSALLAVNLNVSPWIGIFIGAIPAAVIGLLLGLLTLRLRGIFAAVMAWFVGLALLGLTRNLVDLTRGPMGLNTPTLLETSANRPYYFIILAMMLITYLVLKRIINSHYGLAFRAIGQNLDAARASGIDPTYYRVFNFTIQCLFAGWLGGFYAHYFGILTPQVMLTSRTVEVLAIAYIGGRGSLWGGAAVAFPFIFFIEMLRSNLSELPGLHLIIYGLLLILVMIFYPGGFAQLYRQLAAKFSKLRTGK